VCVCVCVATAAAAVSFVSSFSIDPLSWKIHSFRAVAGGDGGDSGDSGGHFVMAPHPGPRFCPPLSPFVLIAG